MTNEYSKLISVFQLGYLLFGFRLTFSGRLISPAMQESRYTEVENVGRKYRRPGHFPRGGPSVYPGRLRIMQTRDIQRLEPPLTANSIIRN